jgi:hypothetical protein
MRRLQLIAVLAVLVPFGLSMTSPASALARVAQSKQPIEVVMSSNPVRLVSSTGQTLYLEIEAETDVFPGQLASAEADVFVSSNDGENHDWSWSNLANGDLFYDPTSGNGTFGTDTQLGSWGSLDLTIAPQAAKPTTSCAGNEQDWDVTLSGTVWFNSHSVWGAFGTKQAPLSFSEASDADAYFTQKALNGCGQPESDQHCNGQVSWDDSGGIHGVVFGNSVGHNGKRGGEFDFFYSHTLDHGNGPQRDDEVFVRTTKPPKVVVTAKGKVTTVRVHAGTHGLITGSATLIGRGRPSIKRHECADGTTSEWDASYTPGANPFTIHMAVGGDFTHRAVKSGASISIESG